MEQGVNESTTPPDERNELTQGRATRFYDRIRKSIHAFVENKGGAVEKTADYLLLVPDVFILLWRLANDKRVSGKDKVLLLSALAYFVSPFDLIPEAIVGPIGYLDDLVFAVYVLNKMIIDSGSEIVHEHWSGSEDVLHMIERVLGAADGLIGTEVFGRIKKMAKRD